MMKKLFLVLLAITVALGVFAGCTQEPEEEAEAQATQVTTTTEEKTEEPAQTDDAGEEEEGYVPENISPTTGLENTTTTYKPVIVQIDNEPLFRSYQTGLQDADVVYETMIEGIDTRLTALYNDVIYTEGTPDKIEVAPVRSSRYYHQWIQSEWDALYVHNGGPDKTNNEESDIWGASGEHIKQRVNGAGKYPSNGNMLYKGSSKSISDVAYVDVKAIAEIYDYEPVEREPFKYYPAEDYADEKEIESIELSFWSKPGWVSYEYDADTDKLTRLMGGKEIVTQETGEAVQVQNLIVQYVSVSDMPNDLGRKKVDVFGSGPAEFIIHGKHMIGTWERETQSDPTKYYLEDGSEVVLTPGNTWIAMHPNDRQVVVNYADGTDYSVN